MAKAHIEINKQENIYLVTATINSADKIFTVSSNYSLEQLSTSKELSLAGDNALVSHTEYDAFCLQNLPELSEITLKANCKIALHMQEQLTKCNIYVYSTVQFNFIGEINLGHFYLRAPVFYNGGCLAVDTVDFNCEFGILNSTNAKLTIYRHAAITCTGHGLQNEGILDISNGKLNYNGAGIWNKETGLAMIGELKLVSAESEALWRAKASFASFKEFEHKVRNLFNYIGPLENHGKLAIGRLEGEVTEVILHPDSETLVAKYGKLKNHGDMLVAGKFVNGFNFFYKSSGELKVLHDGVWINHNYLDVTTKKSHIDGVLVARIWLGALGNLSGEGLVGSKGYAFVNGQNILSAATILAGHHLGLSAAELLLNTNEVFGKTLVVSSNQAINAGSMTGQNVVADFEENLANLSNAKLVGDYLKLSTQTIDNNKDNAADSNSLQRLSIPKYILPQLQDTLAPTTLALSTKPGLIGARIGCSINATRVNSGGFIVSYGWLTMNILDKLNNLMSAYLLAFGDMSLQIRDALVNAGHVVSKSNLSITGAEWLKNIAGGKIEAKELNLIVEQMNNDGSLLSDKAFLHVHKCLHQYALGEISAKQVLTIMAGSAINEGVINCCENLVLNIGKLFKNSGKINADLALSIICAGIIKNSGELKSLGKIKLAAQKVAESIAAGGPLSNIELNSVTEFAIENAGIISAQELSMEAKDWIKNLSAAKIKADLIGLKSNDLTVAGEIKGKKINLQTRAMLQVLSTGLIDAEELLSINTNKFNNAGIIRGLDRIYIDAKTLFKNKGQISSNEMRLLCASIIENAGEIAAAGELKLRAQRLLTQTDSVLSSDSDLELLLDFGLNNAGTLSGRNITVSNPNFNPELKTSPETGILIENLSTGLITAREAIRLHAGKLVNTGSIKAAKQISITATEALSNLQQGNITSKGAFSIICAGIIINSGEISALQSIKLKAERLMQEIATGKIIGKADVELILQFAVVNAGVLSGEKLSIATEQANGFVHNLETGDINAASKLSINTKETETSGKIKSGTININSWCLKNIRTGIIEARDALAITCQNAITNDGKILSRIAKLDAADFVNNGMLQAEGDVTINCRDTIQLLQAGKINIKGALDLIATQRVIVGADLMTHETLKITTNILEHKAGNITAKQDVLLKVTDWLLKGNVAAARNLLVEVANTWQWEGNFDAKVKTKLHLAKGRVLTKDLTTSGSLELSTESNAAMQILSTIKATGDLTLSNGRYTIGQKAGAFGRAHAGGKFSANVQALNNIHGGLYGGASLDLISATPISSGYGVTSGDLTVSDGSYIATNGNALLQAPGFNNNFATFEIGGNLDARLAGNLFYNLAGVVRLGSAEIKGVTKNEMLFRTTWSGSTGNSRALSRAPVFDVRRNLTTHGAFNSYGGALNVGGNFTSHSGGFSGVDYEAFDHWITHHCHQRTRRFCGFKVKTITEWSTQTHHNTHAWHRAALNVHGSVQGFDPNAKYKLSNANINGAANLMFNDFHVAYSGQSSPMPTAIDLSQYHRPSAMFVETPNASDYGHISEVPIDLNTELPREFAVVGSSNAPFRFRPYQEARQLADAMTSEAGKPNLNADYSTIWKQLIDAGVAYQKSLGRALTEADLHNVPYPMLVYVNKEINGKIYKIAKSLLPPGMTLEQGFKAKNADLEGGLGSRMQINGKVKIEENFAVVADTCEIIQQTQLAYENATIAKKMIAPVAVRKLVPNTGNVEVGGKCNFTMKRYRQLGGEVSGAKVKIQADLIELEAGREETTISSSREHSVIPVFKPVLITSREDLDLIAGSIRGTGVKLLAGNKLNVQYIHELVLKAMLEWYSLPTEKKSNLLSTKVSGGSAPSLLGNVFEGREVNLISSSGHTELENVVFATTKKVLAINQAYLTEKHINPQPQLYSYRQTSLVAQIATAVACYYLTPVVGAKLFSGFSAVGQRIAAGMLIGSLRGVVTGGGFEGAAKGFISGAFGGLTAELAVVPSILINTTANQALYGGKLLHNLAASVVSELVSSALHDQTAILKNSPDLLKQVQVDFARSIMTNVARVVISKGEPSSVLNSIVVDVAGGIGGHYGNSTVLKSGALYQNQTHSSNTLKKGSGSKLQVRMGFGQDGKAIYVLRQGGQQQIGKWDFAHNLGKTEKNMLFLEGLGPVPSEKLRIFKQHGSQGLENKSQYKIISMGEGYYKSKQPGFISRSDGSNLAGFVPVDYFAGGRTSKMSVMFDTGSKVVPSSSASGTKDKKLTDVKMSWHIEGNLYELLYNSQQQAIEMGLGLALKKNTLVERFSSIPFDVLAAISGSGNSEAAVPLVGGVLGEFGAAATATISGYNPELEVQEKSILNLFASTKNKTREDALAYAKGEILIQSGSRCEQLQEMHESKLAYQYHIIATKAYDSACLIHDYRPTNEAQRGRHIHSIAGQLAKNDKHMSKELCEGYTYPFDGIEECYFNGKKLNIPTCRRPDLYSKKTGNEYDHKTGKSRTSQETHNKSVKHLPTDTGIVTSNDVVLDGVEKRFSTPKY